MSESNPTIENIKVGKRIKNIRLNLGLTLEQFGKKLGNVSRSSGSKWETGKGLPNKERLKVIADLGNVSVNHLLNGDASKLSTFTTEELKKELERRKVS